MMVSAMASARPCAPGRLELVQDLVNSLDFPDGEDQLASRADAVAWLRRHGARVARVTEAERRQLIDVREALRTLLQANSRHEGDVVDPGAASLLTSTFNAAGIGAVISQRGAQLVPARSGFQGFLGEVGSAIIEATLDGTWPRLKACHSDTCRYAFYDRSKNGCSVWCSMDVCGSRHKARAYRERSRAAVSDVSG